MLISILYFSWFVSFLRGNNNGNYKLSMSQYLRDTRKLVVFTKLIRVFHHPGHSSLTNFSCVLVTAFGNLFLDRWPVSYKSEYEKLVPGAEMLFALEMEECGSL